RGNGDGQFNVPLHAAVGPDDTLYVLDSGTFRVQAFDRDGKFLRSFGKPGKEFGNLARPRGMAVDDDGNIYVTDASFNNFQIFNPEGQLLLTIGEGSLESNPGRYGMLSGISVDETGRIYVVDQLYDKLEVIRRLTESEGQQILEKAKK
ncbi:MAG: SMP-30/gluconolactonase/LRE family protein, partial [Gallionella sp.]